jgi:N-acetylglucosamine kinase-like BadF-type ATPase
VGVIGVDGGNTKTELVAASAGGDVLAYLRGPGSNSHGPGGTGACVAVIASIVDRSGVTTPAEHGAFFLCGADVPADVEALTHAIDARGWVRRTAVDNDTFALLRAGSDSPDAVAVVCGAGINCVGRNARGETARYPSLGWETGDWGGSEMLGREVLFHAARAEDGRGKPTVLADLVRNHFGLDTVAAVGEAVHYRRIPFQRLGELAPAAVAAAGAGDALARGLVERLAEEIALLAARALADLALETADVVLGGGMLRPGAGFLHDQVVARLPAGARPVVAVDPPVVGAALAALDAIGATPGAGRRLRSAFREGLEPELVE